MIRKSDVNKLNEFIGEEYGMLDIKKEHPNGVNIVNFNNVIPLWVWKNNYF